MSKEEVIARLAEKLLEQERLTELWQGAYERAQKLVDGLNKKVDELSEPESEKQGDESI